MTRRLRPPPEYYAIEHTNPKCCAPLAPCICKYATTRPLVTRPEIGAVLLLRAARLQRLNGGLS